MLVFLHGPDDYRRTKRLHALVDQFTSKYEALGVKYFEADVDTNWQEVTTSLRSQTLFSERRLVVVTGICTAPAKVIKELIALVGESKTAHLIATDGAARITKDYQPLLKAPVTSEEFAHLSGSPWLTFIAHEAQSRGATIDKVQLRELARAYDRDSWGVITELELMGLATLSAHEYVSAVQPASQLDGNLWQQLSGLKSMDLETRLGTLEDFISRQHEPAQKLFHLIAYQMREKLPLAAELDRKIKLGKLEYEEALLALVLA